MTCPTCGSSRVVTGPFYDRDDTLCMNCGYAPHRDDKPRRTKRR